MTEKSGLTCRLSLLQNAALNDKYFADRKLYPNVDIYSGVIYQAIGIPTNMSTWSQSPYRV